MIRSDEFYMHRALEQAQRAFDSGEVPVGAVVVDAAGAVIGAGYNCPLGKHCCTACNGRKQESFDGVACTPRKHDGSFKGALIAIEYHNNAPELFLFDTLHCMLRIFEGFLAAVGSLYGLNDANDAETFAAQVYQDSDVSFRPVPRSSATSAKFTVPQRPLATMLKIVEKVDFAALLQGRGPQLNDGALEAITNTATLLAHAAQALLQNIKEPYVETLFQKAALALATVTYQGRQFYVHVLYMHLYAHMQIVPNLNDLGASSAEARQKAQRTMMVTSVFNGMRKGRLRALGFAEAFVYILTPAVDPLLPSKITARRPRAKFTSTRTRNLVLESALLPTSVDWKAKLIV